MYFSYEGKSKYIGYAELEEQCRYKSAYLVL